MAGIGPCNASLSFERDEETKSDGTTCNTSQRKKHIHFLRAIIRNDENEVLPSIKAGVDVDYVYDGKSALFYAVSGGSNRIVETLLKAGANVNLTDDDGKTPLFYCAEKGHRKVFSLGNRIHMAPGFDHNSVASTLIKAGADVNITDNKNKTVLIYSLQSNNIKLVSKLIDSGADVKAIDENGRTALFYPSICENTSVLQKILKSVDINTTDHWGKTALMVAVEQNQESAVTKLIKAGADVNLIDKKGKTALVYCAQLQMPDELMEGFTVKQSYRAIRESKKSILSMLIKAGADMNKRDDLGKTSLIYCVQKGKPVQSSYVKGSRYREHVYTLYIENIFDFEGLASELIKSGADVNITDNESKSALIYALQDANENLASTLLKAGANANMTDEEGKTPLIHYAQHEVKNREQRIKYRYSMPRHFDSVHPENDMTNQDTVASLLIKACFDVNKTDNKGKSALIYCLQDGNKSLACALIEAGADVNITDNEGKTALIYSLEDADESLTCALIQAGADVNITDKEGKTALIYCAQNENESMYYLHKYTSSSYSSRGDTITHSRVASILIKACDDMNKTDNEGKTALIYSLQEDNGSLACALIEAGADVNVVDNDGKTALFYAAIYNNKKLAVNPPKLMHHLNMEQKWDEATTQEHVIPKLLDAGADANSTDKQGRTALMYYAENEYINFINEYLKIEDNFKKDFAHAHVENEYNHVASVLIKASKDVNIVDDQGKTALTYFLQNSKDSCAIELMNAGADVNITDVDGKTVLFYIPADCDKIVIDRIIKSTTTINITDNEGNTALIYSLQNNNEELACALIQAGAEVKMVDNTGRNALFYATIKGYKNAFSKLVNIVDINVIDNQGKTVLIHAVQHVKASFVEDLIEFGAEANIADKDGKTALIYCAQSLMKCKEGLRRIGFKRSRFQEDYQEKIGAATSIHVIVSVASMLIKAGADVNISDNEDKTALIYSLQDGNERLTRLLVEAGADLSVMDENGKTALLYAILYNRSSVVQNLIDAGADINLCDREGKTALIHCAEHQIQTREKQRMYRYYMSRYHDGDHPGSDTIDHNTVASMLIKSNADLNKTDNKGRTALIYSLLNDNQDLACTLIEAGADVNVIDNDGKTALFYSLIRKEARVFQTLMKSYAYSIFESGEESASSLSAQDSQSLVMKLIDAGADVNLAYDEGKTALIYSARNGNKSLVSALIEAGADVNAVDNEGKTALIHCTYGDNNRSLLMDARFGTNHDFRNIAFTLIKSGADVNVADNKGKTALIYCIQNNNEDMVSKLIEAGADANITDSDGVSAIFYAVGNDKIVHLLINNGKAKIKERDHYGRVPLYYAMKESLTSARHLLDIGSGLKRKDCYGTTILSFFIEHSLRGKGHMSEGLNLLQETGIQREAIFEALVNSLFCRILFTALKFQDEKQHGSLSQKPDLKVIIQVLNFVNKYAPDDDGQKYEIIQNIIMMIEGATNLCMAIPKILESLVELGANPSYADTDGNTALHYAACLPLPGASQDTVLKICQQLDDLGASVYAKNHQKQTPLLFCLSKKDWINEDNESSKVKTLVQVCSFLLEKGSSLEEAAQDGKSVFHLIMELFKQGLLLDNDIIRKDILNETLELLNLFPSSRVMKGVTINKRDGSLDSPLHVWAMLNFKFPARKKDSSAVDPYVFEKKILAAIFKHLIDCGANLNDRNGMDQTSLHLCKTWTAAKLLIAAGAKINVFDSEGSPPLLVTIKGNQNVINESDASCIYPDVLQPPKEFWKTVLENKLDPWTVNNDGNSVMSILVKSEAFVLAKALLDVACEGNHIQTDAHAVSLLNAICKDRSTRAQWKSILVEQILKSRKSAIMQRDGEDTPLHHCWRNMIKQMDEFPMRWPIHYLKDIVLNEIMTSVHWTIVKQLLSHRFNCNVLDGSGQSCIDIAHKHPALEDLLKKQINTSEVDPVVIRWTSISKMHKSTLAKVARQQECRQVNTLWYHKNNIQKGSFGLVFVGINQKDGREVAIKRMEKLRMHRPEDKREITSLIKLADCEQVVRYLFYFEDVDFSYVVLELMEGNLTDYLGGTDFDPQKSISLCADVVKGLKYLHDQSIIHRDLKPGNILFKTFPKLCLKIADFGFSRCIDKCSTSATVYGSVAGTRCWSAPEVLKSSYKEHSMPSDVFSCGLLLHYILIVKKHAFSPVDCLNKSELQIHHETEANVLRDNREGWGHSLFPEATDLITCMLDSIKTKRPTATEALAHPMFWPKKKKMEFLIAVANQPEIECPRAKREPPLTPVEIDLEKSFSTIITEETWDHSGYVNMPIIHAEMKRKRKYDTSSVIELVRLIRNTHAHISEDKRPTSIRKLVLEDFVFLECFPNLVMEVFKCIKIHRWSDSREEIKYALDDKMTNKLKGCPEGIPREMPTTCSMEID